MLLHHNKAAFEELIILTANHFSLREHQVEKDYYVSLFLKILNQQKCDIVFRGGTSLSKCYQVINQFSEDIDLSTSREKGFTQGQRKKIKSLILLTAKKLNMSILNENKIESRKDFNCYNIRFPNTFQIEKDTVPHIIVETMFAYRSYPIINKKVTNFILNYLEEKNRDDLIDKFQLHPFPILTQAIERTFVDKIYAICDFYLKNKYHRNSRHLYDVCMIWKSKLLHEERDKMPKLFHDVMIERQKYSNYNPSVQIGENPRKRLFEIISNDFYKDDFNNITANLVYKKVSYEECKVTMFEIIDSGIIPNTIY